MPPQRRKIVPPSTTAKGRRPKVAGTAGRAADTASADAVSAEAVSAETQSTVTASPDKATTRVELTKTPPPAPPSAPKPAAEPDTAPESPEHSAPSSGWPSWRLVSVVGAVAVVLIVFALVAALKPGSAVDNRAWVDQSETSEVTAAATNAIQTLYTYKADTIDEDFDKARAVLNPQMLAEFDKTADTTKSAVVQTKTGTDASLTDIGVTRLEADKAELVVNMNVSATTDGVAQGSAEGPLTVNMEKIDGTWLLSAIDDK